MVCDGHGLWLELFDPYWVQTRTRLGLAWIQPIESGDREGRNDASILFKVVEDDGMKMSDVLMVVCVKLEMGVG